MDDISSPPHPLNSVGVDVTTPQSYRERDDDYKSIVVQLASRWRVIVCKDGIQWVLQHKEASHAGPWRSFGYFTCRDSLIEACGSLNLLSEPLKSELLGSLPPTFHENVNEHSCS